MLLFLVRFLPDRDLAFKTALTLPPTRGKDRALTEWLRAKVLYLLMLSWEQYAHLPVLQKVVRALPRLPERKWEPPGMEADLAAIRAHRSTPASSGPAWRRAERLYRKLLKQAPAEHRSRLLNNMAVCLFHQGRKNEAVAIWRILPSRKSLAAELNLEVARAGPHVVRNLGSVAERGGNPTLVYQARMWEVHKRKLTGPAAKKELDKAKARLSDAAMLYPAANPGKTGAATNEGPQAGFGYSTHEGLVIRFDIEETTWLLLPAPKVIAGTRRD